MLEKIVANIANPPKIYKDINPALTHFDSEELLIKPSYFGSISSPATAYEMIIINAKTPIPIRAPLAPLGLVTMPKIGKIIATTAAIANKK